DVSGVTSNDRKKYKKTSSELDAKQFLCEYDDCGKLFRRSEHLKRHIKSIHTKEKPYSCPYKDCGKSFARTDNLSQHIRIH
ncbi:C2H2-type zinc finger transcription factor, partial [Mucor lusitanicus CBS 277.49]